MTTDDTDNGWDSLAEDLGIEAPAPKAEKPEPAPPPRAARRPPAGHRDPRPEVEEEADDFGAGVTAEARSRAALYDPGPEEVAEDAEVSDEAVEAMEEAVEGDEPPARDDEAGEEGGKRRRRRRRRRKKGGAPDEAAEGEPAADDAADDGAATVEEGEAPAELEGDEDEEASPSAVDEEMEAEAAGPRPEWHVMTWLELVSKLHRPG
jgi:ribonuclease E